LANNLIELLLERMHLPVLCGVVVKGLGKVVLHGASHCHYFEQLQAKVASLEMVFQ